MSDLKVVTDQGSFMERTMVEDASGNVVNKPEVEGPAYRALQAANPDAYRDGSNQYADLVKQADEGAVIGLPSTSTGGLVNQAYFIKRGSDNGFILKQATMDDYTNYQRKKFLEQAEFKLEKGSDADESHEGMALSAILIKDPLYLERTPDGQRAKLAQISATSPVLEYDTDPRTPGPDLLIDLKTVGDFQREKAGGKLVFNELNPRQREEHLRKKDESYMPSHAEDTFSKKATPEEKAKYDDAERQFVRRIRDETEARNLLPSLRQELQKMKPNDPKREATEARLKAQEMAVEIIKKDKEALGETYKKLDTARATFNRDQSKSFTELAKASSGPSGTRFDQVNDPNATKMRQAMADLEKKLEQLTQARNEADAAQKEVDASPSRANKAKLAAAQQKVQGLEQSLKDDEEKLKKAKDAIARFDQGGTYDDLAAAAGHLGVEPPKSKADKAYAGYQGFTKDLGEWEQKVQNGVGIATQVKAAVYDTRWTQTETNKKDLFYAGEIEGNL